MTLKTTIEPPAEQLNYNRSFDVDDLIGELATPKQDFTPKPPPDALPKPETAGTPTGNQGGEPNIFDPTGTLTSQPDEPSEPLTPEQLAAKKRSGANVAKLADAGLSMLGQMYAKADSPSDYKASAGELSDLSEAWAEYLKDKDYDIPPGAYLLFLNLMTYVPKGIKANNDRRFAIQAEINAKIEERLNKVEEQQTNNP